MSDKKTIEDYVKYLKALDMMTDRDTFTLEMRKIAIRNKVGSSDRLPEVVVEMLERVSEPGFGILMLSDQLAEIAASANPVANLSSYVSRHRFPLNAEGYIKEMEHKGQERTFKRGDGTQKAVAYRTFCRLRRIAGVCNEPDKLLEAWNKGDPAVNIILDCISPITPYNFDELVKEIDGNFTDVTALAFFIYQLTTQ